MRVVCLCLLWTAIASSVAFADECSGADDKLTIISKDLARNTTGEAEALLVPLQAAYPNCAKLLLANARVKAAQGASAEAQGLYVRYLDLAPDDFTGIAYYARFLIDQEEYQRADDLSAAAFDHAPNNPAVLAVRGQILDMKRQSREGMELLNKSCELDPDNADAQFQLGALYDRSKRPEDAVKHFEKVVELDPNYSPAWDYLALNLEPLGEVDRADEAYRKGLAVNQKGAHFDAFLDYNYGRFLAKRNQLIESKKYLDRGVELVPEFRATWYDRAKVNLRLHNYTEARTDAEKAASLTEQTGGIIDLQIYSLLEQIYRRLGETELAEKYAALARETPPPVRKGYQQDVPR